MEKVFQILAVILIGVAAFFLWRGNTDGVFVAAVFGAVCFFLSFRFQVKERLEQRKRENDLNDFSEDETPEDDDSGDKQN